MSCYCDAIMEPYRETPRRARKQHTCSECHGPIKPGSQYVAASGLYDGVWSHYKVCGPCWELLHALRDDDCHCICFGALMDQLQDALNHRYAHEHLADLSPVAFGHAFGLSYGSAHEYEARREARRRRQAREYEARREARRRDHP